MQPDDDTIWFRVTQTSPNDVWRYSYGLLTWKTNFGQELGTQKVYGDTDSEVFRLGVGLSPLERTGNVLFRPLAYNRRWISIDDPPTWSLTIEAQSGKTSGAGGSQTVGAVVNSFVDTADNGLSLVRVNFQ